MALIPMHRHALLMAGSFAMNLALSCAAVALWMQAGKTPEAALPPAVAPALMKSSPHLVKAVVPKPFHWHQLEAPDFSTYVKNLRGVGCPEATIRDIVAGELNELQAQQRQELETRGGRLTSTEATTMQAEYAQMLTQLTAPAEGAGTAAAAATVAMQPGGLDGGAPSTASTNPTSPGNPAADIPAAFSYGSAGSAVTQQEAQSVLNANTPNSSLPPAATAALQQMQSDFAQAVGDTNAPADSPAYRARWNQVRRDSDEQFSSMFGGDLFIQTQAAAANGAAASNTKP